jgi:hypothetical protein
MTGLGRPARRLRRLEHEVHAGTMDAVHRMESPDFGGMVSVQEKKIENEAIQWLPQTM